MQLATPLLESGKNTMSKKMLINAIEPEESRIAVLEDHALEELYIERLSRVQIVGNIYKGKVINIEPSLEAAFVEIGLRKNGFLHVSEVREGSIEEVEPGGEFHQKRHYKRIQNLLTPGQEILVQVIKEALGEKGPSLTSYISLAGRFLVLMPFARKHGVSRKIVEEEERRRLREVIEELNPPANMGLIVRTAGANQTKRELAKDLHYLLRLWKAIEEKDKASSAPSLIYQESDLVTKTIRDIYSRDIQEIIVDSEATYEKARDFLKQIMPKSEKSVKLYNKEEPLFHKYNIEEEIEKIVQKKLPLRHGGSLIIEQTEALVAIDVNSGRFRAGADPEETAFRTNMEAAKEAVRQIRLRDLGGVIIIDFIDMQEEGHNRAVEKAMLENLKRDRARTKMLKMSKFGIIELTRQRLRPSLRDVLYENCPSCKGTSFTKTVESLSLEVMREIKSVLSRPELKTIEVEADPRVSQHMLNQKRRQLSELEENYNKRILINSVQLDGMKPGTVQIRYFKADGQPLSL
ncbi:MAG TPA: Rne/Rng family ribonuclease [Candidatus Hypogeohydataceae bacterium YC40]